MQQNFSTLPWKWKNETDPAESAFPLSRTINAELNFQSFIELRTYTLHK